MKHWTFKSLNLWTLVILSILALPAFTFSAEIGDTVFEDTNDNGSQDAGEPGIAGVTVNLVGTGSQVTNANGNYLFTDLPAGTFTVTVDVATVPTALEQGLCEPQYEIILTAGESFLDADFCFTPRPSSIGDTVFEDTNDNGSQDAGEPGIEGVTVNLVGTGSQVTDANGNYLFTNLPPGAVTVTVDVATVPADLEPGQCPLSFNPTLAAGESFLTADFCFTPRPSSIGDTVYEDTNNNGSQDAGEPGIAGVTVNLVGTGSQVTNANGNYLFTDLPAGTFTVTVDVATVPADLEPGQCPLSFNPTLAAGESFLTADFCFTPRPSSIGDTVFEDTNDNGSQDAGEPGIEGVTVNLVGTGSQVTDANGNYLFTNLPPGAVTVTVDVATVPADLEPGQCPLSFNPTLAAGESFLTADFCFTPRPSSIGDTVFEDTNDNGSQDAGEPGIAGVTVNLTLDTGGSDSTATDVNGNYLFTNLPAGATAQVSADPTTAPSHVEPGDTCPATFDIEVNAGESFLNADFCFKLVPDIIGDTVFLDLNDDGVQSPSDPGIPGVTVTLDCDGEPLGSSTTDANGNYLFEGVPVDTACTVDVDESGSSAALEGKAPGNKCPDTFTVTLTAQAPSFVQADFCYLGVLANAGPNQTKDEGSMVNLDGTGSLPDPTTLNFSWSQLSGTDVTLSDPNVAQPNFMAPYVSSGGEALEFDLRVSRNSLFDTDRVTIHVRNINDPPNCGLARPNHDSLWPPAHTMHEITIEGVMDDGSPNNTITLDITGVTQDEPVNGLGDGNVSPDAVIQDDAVADTVLIRAERAGKGNGRVYQIHFTASDGAESCQGTVQVVVPHNRKATAVDDGQVYDSTQP